MTLRNAAPPSTPELPARIRSRLALAAARPFACRATEAFRPRFLLVASLCLLTFAFAGAQPALAVLDEFGIVELSLSNPKTYRDPYADVTLQATFTHAGEESFSIDGFHDGGDTWKVRFRPPATGSWTYRAHFSDGSRGAEGSIEAANDANGATLGIDPANPIWFRRGTKPFLVRALHVGDRFFAANWPDADRAAFLDWVQAQGYNTLSIASHYLNRDEPGRGRGWETPRLWPLDAVAYRQMERILGELRRRGLIVYPFAGFFGKRSDHPTDSSGQERYLRYTLARIGHFPNLFYNLAGPEPNLREDWMPAADVERLGRLVRSLDRYGHPLSVHNETGPDPYRDSDWTTFGTLQGPKTLDRAVLARGLRENHHPAKPLFAQETLWSGNRFHIRSNGRDYSDSDLRKHLFVLTMNAAGLCFADNDGDSSSGFSGTLDLARVSQRRHDILKRAWDLIETLPFSELTPRPDLVDTGHALARPGRHYLVYLESPGTVNVTIEAGPFTIEWINVQEPADRRVTGTTRDGRTLASPSDGDDWLLWLRPATSAATRAASEHDTGLPVPPGKGRGSRQHGARRQPLLLHGASVQTDRPDEAFHLSSNYHYTLDPMETVLTTVPARAGATR